MPLFMVNPPKRKSRKRRTAKQKAATRKMVAARKRKLAGKRAAPARKRSTRKRRVTMARRRGRKRAATRRRRRSTAKRRSPVTTLRRRSVYVTNPRRKRGRRRSFRRNPPLFAQVQQGAMDAGATLVGGAVARIVTGMLPLPKDGIVGVASGLAVAIGVGYAVRQTKIVSADTARFITAGAMQVPIKNLITTFLPQAGAFLGDYDNISAYQLPAGDGVGDYLNSGSMSGVEESYVEVAAYD